MNQKQPELNYSFPLTPAPDLAAAITELGVQCSEEDITRPTAASVQAIYGLMLEELAGISMDSFDRPKAQILNGNRDYYNDALTLQMFHHHVSNVALNAGIQNFSLSDIIRPEPRKTLRILSALINFCKFKQERVPIYDEIQHDVEALLQRRDQVEFELAQEQKRLEELRQLREEEVPRIQAAKERNESHKRAMRQLHKTQTSTTNELAVLKEEKKRLTERLSNVQYEIQTASLANESQKARIVQSPERLKRTIQDMGANAGQERMQLAEKEKAVRELQVKLDFVSILEQDVRACIEALHQIDGEMTRLDEADRKLDRVRTELDGKSTESRELETKAEQLARQLSNATDKLSRAQRSAMEKREAAQLKIDRLREEYEDIAREREAKEKLMVGKRREVDLIEGKIADHLATNQTEFKTLLEEYFRLRDRVAEYQAQLNAKLGLEFRPDIVG